MIKLENSDSCYGQRTPPHHSVRPDGKYVQREDIHRSLVVATDRNNSHSYQFSVLALCAQFDQLKLSISGWTRQTRC